MSPAQDAVLADAAKRRPQDRREPAGRSSDRRGVSGLYSSSSRSFAAQLCCAAPSILRRTIAFLHRMLAGSKESD